MYTFRGIPIYVSDKPNKKYYAVVLSSRGDTTKKIYFGQRPYEQYRDKLGYYSKYDHNDKQRRKNFKARHEANRHTKYSPAWFADQILW